MCIICIKKKRRAPLVFSVLGAAAAAYRALFAPHGGGVDGADRAGRLRVLARALRARTRAGAGADLGSRTVLALGSP